MMTRIRRTITDFRYISDMSKTTPINTFRFSLFCWVLLFAVSFTEGQDRQPQSKTSDHPCHQDRVDRERLIAEAERNEFNVKHVEILGNTYTQGRSFFRIITVNEGDIFTRRNLEIAVKPFQKWVQFTQLRWTT